MSHGTLVMMHGMTGTAAKMQPLAESLAPEGWGVLCPQAEIEHPTKGGYAWWLRADDTISHVLDSSSQSDVDDSLIRVTQELPDGPIIVGGFSQGGAMASALLETDVQDRIVGLVLIATKTIRPESLEASLLFLKPRPVVWMHGKGDHRVPIDYGYEHAEIFEAADWPVIRLEHEKGHMVNLKQFDELKSTIQEMANSI